MSDLAFRRTCWALALLAVLAYLSLFFAYRLNVPYQDDMNDILAFLMHFTGAETWAERLAAWYEPQNNHRTGASRLLYLAVYGVLGHADFTVIAALAGLAWLSLPLLYSRMSSQPVALVLCLGWLILATPRAFTLPHWAMTASHFYYLVFLGAACFLALARPGRRRFVLAMGLATIASFVGAAGLLTWIAGGAWLGWEMLRGRRELGQLLVWLFWSVLISTLAFEPMPAVNPLPVVPEAGLWHDLQFLLVLLGSGLAFDGIAWAMACGALLLSCLSYAGLSALATDTLGPLHVMLALLLLMALAVVLGRADYASLDYALTARYSVISANLLLCLVLLALRQGPWLQAAIVLALALNLATYYFYGPQYEQLMKRRANAFNKGNYPVMFRDTAEMNQFVAEAEAAGIYRPPERPQAVARFFSGLGKAPDKASRR